MIRIGLDIGGTGIKIGAVDEKNHILAEASIPTRKDLPFEEQVQQMADCVLSLLDPKVDPALTLDNVVSVGAGIPGIANGEGVVIDCTNLDWRYTPLRAEFQKRIDKPFFVDNDANVAALAESVAGISRGTSSSVFITLGTGIGSGIIINGKIWKGFHHIGAELGHMILELDGYPCTCGNHGCVEQYCSATALIRMAREQVAIHPDSLILSLAEGDSMKITAKTVFDAVHKGDFIAERVFRRYVSYLSQMIAGVINLLDPEIILLGGGVSKAGSLLLDAVRKEFRRYVLFNDQPLPEVAIASLGAEAGIIGAAMLS
ncbi:MAG: ROK family glucokinase [Clostridiales bacterium]|nr:ROK family glucokinase [Clostridiales bacterium]